MDPRTLEALKGSIAKWEAIVAGTGRDYGTDNCPLCREFYDEIADQDYDCCDGCPVMNRTGKTLCENTPYYDYKEAPKEGRTDAALAELAFLKSLLPTEPNLSGQSTDAAASDNSFGAEASCSSTPRI